MTELATTPMYQFCMVARSGPPEAMTCPFFLCAVCGGPVYSVPSPDHQLPGYVLWRSRWDDKDGRDYQDGPVIVHRPDCMRELEERDPAWARSSSLSLADVLDELVHNTTHPLGTDNNDPEFPGQAEYVAPWPSRWRVGHYGS